MREREGSGVETLVIKQGLRIELMRRNYFWSMQVASLLDSRRIKQEKPGARFPTSDSVLLCFSRVVEFPKL